jgi:hypothetical protein
MIKLAHINFPLALFLMCSMVSCSRNYKAHLSFDPTEVDSIQIEEIPELHSKAKIYEIDVSEGEFTITANPDHISSIIISANLRSGIIITHTENIIISNREVKILLGSDAFVVKVVNEAYF